MNIRVSITELYLRFTRLVCRAFRCREQKKAPPGESGAFCRWAAPDPEKLPPDEQRHDLGDAEIAPAPSTIVQRAADAFLAKELRHQNNRKTIAIKAIEHLKETPEAETTKPDDDWLNMYARHAQEASSDRLQDMWARILAGQLRNTTAPAVILAFP